MTYTSVVEALGKEWLVEREQWRILSLRDSADPSREVTSEERTAVLEHLAAHHVYRIERRQHAQKRARTTGWGFSLGEDPNSPHVSFEPVRGDAIYGWQCGSCGSVLPGPDQHAAVEHAKMSAACAR